MYSINSTSIELESTLLDPKQLATGAYPEPDKSSPHPTNLFLEEPF
jgi:hypothetical protein